MLIAPVSTGGAQDYLPCPPARRSHKRMRACSANRRVAQGVGADRITDTNLDRILVEIIYEREN